MKTHEDYLKMCDICATMHDTFLESLYCTKAHLENERVRFLYTVMPYSPNISSETSQDGGKTPQDGGKAQDGGKDSQDGGYMLIYSCLICHEKFIYNAEVADIVNHHANHCEDVNLFIAIEENQLQDFFNDMFKGVPKMGETPLGWEDLV